MTKIKNPIDITKLLPDYEPQDNGIWEEEEFRTRRLKHIVMHSIPITDRNIIIYYAECMSQRKLARKLGVSLASANILLKRIRQDIIRLYNEDTHGHTADCCGNG